MTRKLLMVIPGSILGISLAVCGGTYALFSASASSGGNNFQAIEAGNIQLISSRAQDTQEVSGPMFYGVADDPNGEHPYDAVTPYPPNDEAPGEWAPGDQVTRMWNIENKGSADAQITRVLATLQSITKNGVALDPSSQTYQDFMQQMGIAVYSPTDNYANPVYSGTLQQLLSGNQWLTSVLYIAGKSTSFNVKFVASMGEKAGNDLQGVKGVFSFILTAEQVRNNDCFEPPFRNRDFSLQQTSTVPIKFHFDADDDRLITTSNGSVRLVIAGPGVNGGTETYQYSMSDGTLSFNGGHYQVNFDTNVYPVVTGGTYTATVYKGTTTVCQKQFTVTTQGSRSNAP